MQKNWKKKKDKLLIKETGEDLTNYVSNSSFGEVSALINIKNNIIKTKLFFIYFSPNKDFPKNEIPV